MFDPQKCKRDPKERLEEPEVSVPEVIPTVLHFAGVS